MAERATIARPYAKAAFEYAHAGNALAAWSQGLKVAAEIATDPRVARLINDPRWTAADLAGLITDAAGPKLDAAMQNFVRVLAENHRLVLLPEIAAHYEAARAQVENTVDVDVISAVALDAAQAEKLKQALNTAAPPGAHAEFRGRVAPRRRRDSRRGSRHRRLAQGSSRSAWNRIGRLTVKVTRGPSGARSKRLICPSRHRKSAT